MRTGSFFAGLAATVMMVLNAAPVQAQLPQDRLAWTPSLQWEDFKGSPQEGSPFHAITHSGLSYTWSLRTGPEGADFRYQVEAFFTPLQSWVRREKASGHLLEHEQLHFDITELFARKLRNLLAGFEPDPGGNVREELQAIYQVMEKERVTMQELYDRETEHSRNAQAQAKWKERIRKEMNALLVRS